MVKVRLADVFVEHKKKAIRDKVFGEKGGRWFAAVALDLVEENAGKRVADWYYLVVCSPGYKVKPFRKGPVLDSRYVVLQEEFDINGVEEIAKHKVSQIDAKDWDEFHDQMNKYFLYED